MTTATVPTFTATIYVGLKERRTGEIADKEYAIAAIQKYVDVVGLCVTVTETQFVYTSGTEQGIAIGLINYPRFPSQPDLIKSHAISIAEMLLKLCKQQKVSIVMPHETVMISTEERI